MYKLISNNSTQSFISLFFRGQALSQFISAFMGELMRVSKMVNRRALSTLSTTIVLSALLTACGGGGGGGVASDGGGDGGGNGGSTPTTPTLTVSSNSHNLTQNFTGSITIATITNADRITVTQSNPGVINITTTNARVSISSIANASGQTNITITAFNGSVSSPPQVVAVQINPPAPVPTNTTPTLTVSSNSHNLIEGFTGFVTIATATNATQITFTQSQAGVVNITTTNARVSISSIANASGRTTLTITAFNGSVRSPPQVVVVQIDGLNPNTTPTLTVLNSSYLFTVGFTAPITIATATNANLITVTQSQAGVVSITTSNASVSISSLLIANGRTTLTITAFNGSLSPPPQVVVVDVTLASPTVTILSNSHNLLENFSDSINIATITNADRVTVTQSQAGVVSITTSNTGVSISNIANASGRTTLTITAFNGSLSSTPQVVVVEVTLTPPTLTVLSNTHNLTEGFSNIITIATATNADRITVTQSNTGVVSINTSNTGVTISSILNGTGRTTLTITAFNGSVSSPPQVVVVQVTRLDPNTTPTLSVLINSYNLQEDFADIIIATAVNADRTMVTQSQAGVVNITTSASNVRLSSLPHMSGQTNLTITAFNGSLQSSNEIVVVNVSPVNDLPIITLSTESITVLGGFSPITIATTITDADHNVNFSYTIQDANPGLVSAMITPNAFILSPVPGGSGTTTLTVRSSADPLGGIGTRTISVVVINSPPVMNLSTSLILVQEDFSNPIVVRATITDAEPGALSITVTSATSIVNAVVSPPVNNVRTITLTPVAHAYGRTTLTVQATDVGGKTTSSEVVVAISAVNDTPTLSVSQNSIIRSGAFTPITIHTTASDVEDSVLSLDVQQSTTGVIDVTTTTNSILLQARPGGSGQTTLTVRVVDSSGSTAVQTITVNITIISSGSTPVLQVSTTRISLQEDFRSPFVINTTETDGDGEALTFSITSTTYLVDAVISSLSSDMRTITLMPVANAHGTTTLFVQTSDIGGLTDSTEIVVVVNPVNDPVTLSLPVRFFSTASAQASYRNIYSININHIDNDPIEAQLQVTSDIPVLFSANPAPVASFTTHTLTTTAVLNSGSTTAHLYFTIRPNQASAIATLSIQLNNLTRSEITPPEIFVVQAFQSDVPPAIIRENTSLRNLVVHGGHLYANSAITSKAIAPFLAQASALGGHLVNINTVEEFDFLRSSGFVTNEAWYGLVLPQLNLPGELFWRTNNSTLAYGFVSTSANATGNISVYPGIYPLAWESASGLIANRPSSVPSTFNWTIYNSSPSNSFFLLGDGGDTLSRSALYEFPQGLTPTSNPPVVVTAGARATVRLTGYDLNGGSISTTDWSATSTVGTFSFTHVSATTGVQTVDFHYTAPGTFSGEITVTATLTMNSTTTSFPLRFVTVVPTFTLPTNRVVLTENSSQTIRQQLTITNVSIPALAGTTTTRDLEWRITGNLGPPFSVQPAIYISFSTNATVSTASIGSVPQTAQLYFSIAPDSAGPRTVLIQLRDPANTIRSVQQLLTVQVNPVAEPPAIVQASPNLQNLVVHGGHLYANSATPSRAITPFLTQANALGGHLANINTNEEFTFLQSGAGGISITETWYGLVLPQRHFPGELFWVTNDSTIAYGYASTDNVITYPGHYSLSWAAGGAVRANRGNSASTLFNWTVYTPRLNSFFLLDDIGDGSDRFALYEFPQGLPATPIQMNVTSTVTVRLTGFDLDGDAITAADWSATAAIGTVNLMPVSQARGVQTMDLVYTAPQSLVGQTTVVVTLTVNGLSTSRDILFTVLDAPPTIALSTNAITVDEEFTTFTINATATDRGFSGTLPIAVRASHDQRVMNISTTTNGFQFSGANNYFGVVTLTVQTTDTIGQIGTADVIVTIQPTPDTPTISVTTNHITVINGSAPFSIGVTTRDVDDLANPAFNVQASTSSFVSITTAVNSITLNAIPGATGQTTLTVFTTDLTGLTATQTIVVNVVIVLVGSAPTLSISTSLIYVQEDFSTPVSIQVDGNDSDNDVVTLSLSSSSYLVDAVLASPTTGIGSVVSTITLTSISNLSGTATLTVIVTDDGGRSTTQETVIVVTPAPETNPLSFTVSTSAITLSAVGNQLNRNIQNINILNPGDLNLRTQFTVTSSGADIFSTNPAPVVSFTSNALTTSLMLSAPMHTAQLYFSIAPNKTGTATLTIQLDDLDRRESTQQTVVVSVNTENVAPLLIRSNRGLQNLVIHGGRLYANSMLSVNSVNPFLAEARTLGGHLINLNTVEELNFIRSTGTNNSGLTTLNAWFGLIVRQLEFPGLLSWETNDSTIAYGFATGNGANNLTVYPGHFALNWGDSGLFANRGSTRPSVFNAVNYSPSINAFFLLGDRGDVTPRVGLYEFPQGLPHPDDLGLSIFAGTSTSVRYTGMILTGETITRAHWSATASAGTAIINTVSQSSGMQTVDMVYTAPANFVGTATVIISLQVNGVVTTSGVGFNISLAPSLSVNVAGIKTLNFSWSSISGATRFRLETNPDGNSGFTNLSLLSTTGIVISPNSTNIAQQTAQGVVAVHRYYLNVNNPQFGVRTCFTTCEAGMRHNVVTVTNSTLNDMIGSLIRAPGAGVGNFFDEFSYSLDLSGDGNTFIAGASVFSGGGSSNFVNDGAAYVFARNGSTWAQQAFLQVPPAFHSSNDFFGYSVSINANGNTVAVGANNDDGLSTLDTVNEGAVYIFGRSGTAWTYVTDIRASNRQAGDLFGRAVSLSDDGNTLAVGAIGEDDSAVNSGAAYIFTRSGSTWAQQAFIKAPDAALSAGANFGQVVTLSADGNTLAVGAQLKDRNTGGVYIFRRNGTTWSNQGGLIRGTNPATAALDQFGFAISLSANGNTLAVGAPDKDAGTGAAYVFRFNGTAWVQQQFIRSSDTARGDTLGRAVSLSADGNFLAVGATNEDGSSKGVGGVKNNSTINSGAVYTFEFGTTWVERAYVKASNPAASRFFGRALSLSNDGNSLLVGSNANTIYLY